MPTQPLDRPHARLLAPQFGLGRTELDSPQHGAFEKPFWENHTPAPTVIHKRRRLPDAAALSNNIATNGDDPAAGTASVTRAPKVFRVDSPHEVARTPEVQPKPAALDDIDALFTEAPAPVMPRRPRRRRDEMRKPTLLQHLVYERPTEPAPDVAAAHVVDAEDVPDEFVLNDDDLATASECRDVVDSLSRIRADLSLALQADAFVRSFERLL